MALIEEAVEGVVEGPGVIVLGLGAVLLAPVALPVIGRLARPATKAVIRGYLATTDYLSGMAAEVRERTSDLVAEVSAERKGKGRARAARA
jgi:hypothetical protein